MPDKDPRKVAAGRKGGQANIERHGAQRMRDIARQGGAKGGNATLARYGREHFQRIGRLRWQREQDQGG